MPELFVQGIVVEKKDEKLKKDYWKQLVPIYGILSGRYPVTIIDLCQRQVR